ncbi:MULTISPECIES: hypothetical protein [unclassified Microbacterium]|uniref:hypothetical protein n=1 Tax=unclassified Microbacterium TaxID=2609290 RepID=UPI0012F9B9CF|nr:hypothetical protein [Microbacterium sp. MAH-37]MVQ42846.1 hypothetical protein [Microbacterium sp. MAH-37]
MTADAGFSAELRRAVDAEVESALREPSSEGAHRHLMDRVRLLVAAFLWPQAARSGDGALIDSARESVAALRALQGPSGLFVGGDNVDSPPDSAFTVNDLCDTLRLLDTQPHERTAEAEALAAELADIADAVEPALLVGGVHTPNHRWEISAALARLHRRRPAAELTARAAEWLAEGVDITADGIFSERSANYAAYVSNPSLTVIADVFGAQHARDAVIRNLEATLGMIHPDGTVETVHSRRQDQLTRFPLAPYLLMYRRYAIELGRGDFAWAAERALAQGIVHPAAILTELLLDPRLGDELPTAVPPKGGGTWAQSGLVVDADERRRLVVFGGSDYPRFRRVRSGLSTNPTFLRMFADDAVLDSIRLSRDFFGLGPFRADGLRIRDDGGYRLTEEVSASYYQPFTGSALDSEGEYSLTDDGRFFGSMSFPERRRDVVALRTAVSVVPTADGAVIGLDLDGPDCAWALELAFRGGEFDGGDVRADGTVLLGAGAARYRSARGAILVTADAGYRANGEPAYRPGEDYAFLGATDAATGDRLYLTGRSPGRVTLTLRAETATS